MIADNTIIDISIFNTLIIASSYNHRVIQEQKENLVSRYVHRWNNSFSTLPKIRSKKLFSYVNYYIWRVQMQKPLNAIWNFLL